METTALYAGQADTAAPLAQQGSRSYAILVCVFASLGGVFFGYDQGVTGGVLVMDSFLNAFCVDYGKNTRAMCHAQAHELPTNWLTFTTLYNVVYYVGCIVGAFAGGYVADKFGRRVTCFSAGFLFCTGTLWVVLVPVQAHMAILCGRVLQGMGVGNSSFSLPIFGAEMAPKELRGFLSGFMQMMVVTGLLLANIVNVVVEHVGNGWRYTNAVAMLPPIIVMLGIFCVPESPRWVYQKKGRDVAHVTLQRIRQTEDVQTELDAIGDQIAVEGDHSIGWNEIFSMPTIRRRMVIAMALQLLQQATGINAVFTYGGQIFKDVIGDGVLSLLILTSVNFVSTIPAMRWVDTMGRRQLLLLGAAGMSLGHIVSAITFMAGCHGNTEDAGCSNAAGYVIVAATSFFVFNFAISWGPVCWIYPPEIFPLNVRAKAVSISTMANWSVGALMIGIPKLFPYLNINGVFFLFAGLCAVAWVFVYCMCPETKGVLLEDVEALFDGFVAGFSRKRHRRALSPKYEGAQTPDVS